MAQCKATANRTGRQCQKRAVAGAVVCLSHGAAAGQVREKARARVALSRAAELLDPGVRADPGEVLEAAVRSSAALLGAAEAAIRAEEPDADALRQLGEAALLAGRLAKLALDAGLDQRLTWQAERNGELVGSLVTRTIEALGLGPDLSAAAFRHIRLELEAHEVAAGPAGRLTPHELDAEIARVVRQLDAAELADALAGFPAKLARAVNAGVAVLDLTDDQHERVAVAVESFLRHEAEESARLAADTAATPAQTTQRAWWADNPRYAHNVRNGGRR